MSGGMFDYSERRIEEIAEKIREEIESCGKLMRWSQLSDFSLDRDTGRLDEWTNPYVSDLTPEVAEDALETYRLLLKAYGRVKALDYLLCSDIGQDTYFERVNDSDQKAEAAYSGLKNQVDAGMLQPEHLNRCIFCKNYVLKRRIPRIPACRASGAAITDPMLETCEKFDRYEQTRKNTDQSHRD